MRKIQLDRLIDMARLNYCESDLAILRLQDDFMDGRVQACKARKLYRQLRESFLIDGKRYARIMAASTGKEKEKFFDVVRLCEYDDFFRFGK